jgi:hypothetical protein
MGNRIGDNLEHTGTNKPLVSALVGRAVDFIVIGGLAVSWYCDERQADDMDLLIDPTTENSARVHNALVSLDVPCFDSRSFARLGVKARIDGVYYAELLTPHKDGPTFAEVAADAAKGKLLGFPARIASPASLIRMKRHAAADAEAQRAKHLADISCLEQHAV